MIEIFTTGGTIDKIYFDAKSEYHVGDPQAINVLSRANVSIDYTLIPLLKKDSLDITEKDRIFIKEQISASPSSRILITHGTDTMVQTAQFLDDIPNKTIVMTGSMYPAELRDSDAVFNIGSAIVAVQLLAPGVHIVMNGRVFDPQTTVKNTDLKRFEDVST